MTDKKLLVVWVYYPAVGHLVEAINVAANYYAANPGIEVSVLVNRKAPYHIVEYCSFIQDVYTLDLSDKNNQLDDSNLNPDKFDFIIYPSGLKYANQHFPEPFSECYKYLQSYFKPKIWSGYNKDFDNNPYKLNFKPYSVFKILVPQNKISYNFPEKQGNPKIAVMLKGSSKQSVWPSLKTWKHILLTIKEKYPSAQFFITGIYEAHETRKRTLGELAYKINRLVNSIPNAYNCYNVGLVNQLGIIQNSDAFLSPHTGFAFLAPCLGTPWLALSGGEWEEDMMAGIPFYSVLPKCDKYPCHSGDIKLGCKVRLKLNQPIKCMASLSNKTSEILGGLTKILDKDYSFEQAFADYEALALAKGVNVKKMWRIKEFNQY